MMVHYACSGCGEAFVTEDQAQSCCKEKTVNEVSECCHAEILIGIKKDYPLGGSTWYVEHEFHYCNQCEQELD